MTRQELNNRAERHKMSSHLAVIPQDVERNRILKASYSLEVKMSVAQRRALIETALDRGLPAGRVLARQLSKPDKRGRDIEIISGWHFLETYWEENDRSVWVNVSLIEAEDADAVFYGIQNAYEEAKTAGYQVTVIEYAEAAQRALEQFREYIPNLTRMAAALRIGRPTLANRMRLLDKLAHHVVNLVREGRLSETAAKTLMSVDDDREQTRYAEMLINNPMTKDNLYSLVNPDYIPKGRAEVKPPPVARVAGADEISLMRRIESRFGARVTIDPDQKGQGTSIALHFHSAAELLGLAERLKQGGSGVQGSLVCGNIVLRSESNTELDALLTLMRVTEEDF